MRRTSHVGESRHREVPWRPGGFLETPPSPSSILHPPFTFSPPFLAPALTRALGLLLLLCGLLSAQAAVRFDVFLGYDGILPEASWFPVVCEVQNDGPTFNALVEITSSLYQSGQRRVMAVELPTGTTKRFVIPVFAASRYGLSWDARLLDERGRVRAEMKGLRVRKQSAARVPLVAAVARTMPVFPDIKTKTPDFQPVVARVQSAVFPDNPIALEGLDVLYLSSEKALDLKVNQVNALIAWLRGGGRLVVGVEQLVHLNGCEWLHRLLPVEVTGLTTVASHPQLQDWLTRALRSGRLSAPVVRPGQTYQPPGRGRPTGEAPPADNPYADLKPDPAFESQPLQVAVGTLRDGQVLIGSTSQPLAVSARRGRGEVIALLFSPELEPFTSWKHRPSFWARLVDLPPELLTVADASPVHGGSSMDGVFGAMIDSRQVRKLPVGWLLVLLLGYLVVIGPLDQYWLKKINRQMWTWLTFPAYVAFFSLLIYFIGYKLRAGETEYNELHVVDLIPSGDQADWRGRTYASIYSPVNARYRLASDLPFATLRGELSGGYGSAQETSRATVEQRGNNFEAELSVPVWTSQLFVGDWWRRGELPLSVSVATRGASYEVEVDNRTETPVSEARLVIGNKVFDLGRLPARQITKVSLEEHRGATLSGFLMSLTSSFEDAVQQRHQAFSTGQGGFINDAARAAMATSLIGAAQPQQGYNRFVAPAGLDLVPLLERGDAVLLAWAPNWTPVKPMNRFSPRRSHRDTLLRVAVPLEPQSVGAFNR